MIEQTIDFIISTCKPQCSEGWLDDANHFFGENKAWTNSNAVVTKDARCLLELKAIVSPSVNSLRDLRIIQREIWQNLAWSSFEASAINDYHEASVLRFITVVKGNSSCTTGRMIIAGDHYHELVRRAENHRRSELPRLPFTLDLSDLETQLLIREQVVTLRRANDWNEDKLLIPDIRTLIQRIENCIAAGKQSFFDSTVSQDALRFNLDALTRITGKFSMGRSDVFQWRKQLLEVCDPATRPWQRDAIKLWTMAEEHVPRLLPLIDMNHEQA